MYMTNELINVQIPVSLDMNLNIQTLCMYFLNHPTFKFKRSGCMRYRLFSTLLPDGR